jgi:hypothetical protein
LVRQALNKHPTVFGPLFGGVFYLRKLLAQS